MKIIGLVPVRNEAWVLPHSLASLSGFCDIIIVSDQNSDDESREICRRFPKVLLLESTECRISTQVRWQLFDAARSYDGCNLMWCTDADELVAPAASREFFAARRDDLTPGTIVECMFIHPWHSPTRYREYHWGYAPHFKALAFVDDRRMDYDRSRPNSIHEPRVPIDSARSVLRAGELHVLHLQWLLAGRTQMRQAWYRCRECSTASRRLAINESYADDPARLRHPHRCNAGLVGRGADLSRPGDRSRAVVERARHPRVVRPAWPGVLRAAGDLAHPGAARGVRAPRRPAASSRSFVPPAVAGARGAFGRRRRGGGATAAA